MQKSYKVFLDTSAILSGLNSPSGAAGVVLAFCFTGQITPIISPQVIEEAERNIAIALAVNTDFLITWNTKDFLRSNVVQAVPFKISLPGDFLNKYLRTTL